MPSWADLLQRPANQQCTSLGPAPDGSALCMQGQPAADRCAGQAPDSGSVALKIKVRMAPTCTAPGPAFHGRLEGTAPA